MKFSALLLLSAMLAAAQSTVEITVINSVTNEPVPGAQIRVQRGSGEPTFLKTDEHGRFAVDLKGARIAARYPGMVEELDSPRRPLTIPLTPQAIVSGKITTADGTPVEGRQVQLLEPDEGLHRSGAYTQTGSVRYFVAGSSMTNDRGEYRIAAPPGSYFVYSQGAALELIDRATFYPHALEARAAKRVAIVAGKPLTGVDIALVRESGVKVRGRIVSPPGVSLDGLVAFVVIWSLATNNRVSTAANITSDGFELGNVLPGGNLLEAELRDVSDVQGLRPLAVAHQQIQVGAEDLDGVEVKLTALQEITGSLTYASGCDPAPLMISTMTAESHLTSSHQQVSAVPGTPFSLHFPVAAAYRLNITTSTGHLLQATGNSAEILLGDARIEQYEPFQASPETKGPLSITIGCRKAGR